MSGSGVTDPGRIEAAMVAAARLAAPRLAVDPGAILVLRLDPAGGMPCVVGRVAYSSGADLRFTVCGGGAA